MIRDRELEKMAGDTFVPEDGSGILDGSSNIKVFRLRIVGWDEKETGRIFVVNAGRIHEPARTCRLERFRQLPDLKCAKVIWQRHQIVFLQEVDHIRFTTL